MSFLKKLPCCRSRGRCWQSADRLMSNPIKTTIMSTKKYRSVCCVCKHVKELFAYSLLTFDDAKVRTISRHMGGLPSMQTTYLQQRKKQRDFHHLAKIPISKPLFSSAKTRGYHPLGRKKGNKVSISLFHQGFRTHLSMRLLGATDSDSLHIPRPLWLIPYLL